MTGEGGGRPGSQKGGLCACLLVLLPGVAEGCVPLSSGTGKHLPASPGWRWRGLRGDRLGEGGLRSGCPQGQAHSKHFLLWSPHTLRSGELYPKGKSFQTRAVCGPEEWSSFLRHRTTLISRKPEGRSDPDCEHIDSASVSRSVVSNSW